MQLFSIFLSLVIHFSFFKPTAKASAKDLHFTHSTIANILSEEGFAAGTLVATVDGYKPIEIITKNDLILDHNDVPKKVFNIGTKNVSSIICIVIDGYKIYTGRDQLFDLSCTQQWCKASDLNDLGIESSLIQGTKKLYQLTVEGHIFCIEKSDIIVHNVDLLSGGLCYILMYSNPVTAVIGTTVGLSAMAYSAYMIYQAQQVAHLARMAMVQKDKESTHKMATHERESATKNIATEKENVVTNQEIKSSHEHIKKESKFYPNFLERRAQRLDTFKKHVGVPSHNSTSPPDPLKPDEEEEKKRKEEEDFKKKHPNGRYGDASYHRNYQSGNKSPRPRNGQDALDNSFEVKGKEKIRISLSDGQFVVLTRTLEGLYHGHVRVWSELIDDMKNVLIQQGLVKRSGKII